MKALIPAALASLLSRAHETFEEVNLFVFSDHGMTDVTSTFDLMARVEMLDLRFGKDYAAVYDSTMARFWFLNDAAERRIREVLAGIGAGRVLSDEELQPWGCDFPGKRYGDLFFLLNPGVLLCPSFMGRKRIAGMHGYEPTHAGSKAAFLSNVELDVEPEGLRDMFEVMLACGGAGLVEPLLRRP